jgi:hypothetical protein
MYYTMRMNVGVEVMFHALAALILRKENIDKFDRSKNEN